MLVPDIVFVLVFVTELFLFWCNTLQQRSDMLHFL